MPFTMPDYRRLSPEEASPWMHALQTAMQGYQQGVQAKYAPRMQEAEIFHKTISPLANLAISPLFMAMNPSARQTLTDIISQMLTQGNIVPGGMPGMRGGKVSLGGMSGNMMPGGNAGAPQGGVGGYSGTRATPQEIQDIAMNGNNAYNTGGKAPGRPELSPSGTPSEAASAGVIGGFNKQIPEKGAVYTDPKTNQRVSTPAESTVSNLQQINSAIERITPTLDKLAKESAPFLSQGSYLKLLGSKVAGGIRRIGAPESMQNLLGGTELNDKYNEFLSDQAKAVESLMSALNLPKDAESIHKVENILTPGTYETEAGYKKRMLGQISELLQRQQQNTEHLRHGYDLSAQGQQGQQVNQIPPVTPQQGMPNNPAVQQQLQQGNERVYIWNHKKGVLQ